MYVQGGKLFCPPNVVGLADREGLVREMDGGMVVARIDASGYVAGPNNEFIGKVGRNRSITAELIFNSILLK
jgi:hypothetical protein